MKLSTKRIEFTDMLTALLTYGLANGMEIAIDWVKRDVDTQAKFVNRGISKTMHSKHLRALAVDLLLFDEGEYITDGDHPDYKKLGDYWEKLGGTWGGNWTFKDSGHFEFKEE